MSLWSKEEFDLYQKIINLNQSETYKVMEHYLKSIYDKVITDDAFIYAVGDIPIALVSHMDTVFEETIADRTCTYQGKKYLRPKRNPILYYDQWKEIIACPTGAGSDDKAGIYAIFKILESELRPTIILTTDEEIGAVGARKMVNAIDEPLSELKYIIQLDRRGTEDCVFYDLDNPEFTKYIESFGFKTAIGSFSDISVICPAWGVAGVNLSIGYENEHSVEEILYVDAWLNTIDKVKVMLQEEEIPLWVYTKNFPTPLSPYAYYDEDYYGYEYCFGPEENPYGLIACACCGDEYDIFDTEPIMDADGKLKYYCLECLTTLDFCTNCGTPFKKKRPGWHLCKNCSKEKKRFGKKRNNN